MNNMEFKAGLVCVVAFVMGCLIACSGCAMGTATRVGVGQNQYETGAGIYIEKKQGPDREDRWGKGGNRTAEA